MRSLTIIAVGTVAIATAAHAQDQEQIDRELAKVRADLAELRAECEGTEPWLSQQRADEIRSLVRDCLADAGSRVSLQEAGATAGRRDKFFISSADGNFNLNLYGYVQMRYAFDHQPSTIGLGGDGSTDTWGASVRRVKMYFEGHVVDPTWKYKIEMVSSQGSAASFDDLYIEKKLADGLDLRTGQFKVPFMRETLISDSVTELTDRSGLEGFFSAGRAAGVQLAWETEQLRLTGGFFNGFEVKSGYFNSGSMRNIAWDSTKIAQYAFAARAEWKPVGKWSQFKDTTGWRTDGTGLMIGVAGEVEKKDNTQGTAGGATNPFVVAATADVSVEFAGANLLSYFVYRQVNPETAGLANSNQWGFLIQGGYFLSDSVEAVVRYEYGDADTNPNDNAPALTMLNNGYAYDSALTFGINWYISGQKVKLAWDIGYAFDGVGAFANAPSAFLADGTSAGGEFNQSGQVLTRFQLQVMW